MSKKKSLKKIIDAEYGEMNLEEISSPWPIEHGGKFNDLLYTWFDDCTFHSRIKVLDTLGKTHAPRYDVYAKGVKYIVVIPRYISVLDTGYTKAFLIGRSSKCGNDPGKKVPLVIKEIQINEEKGFFFELI